MWKIAHFKKSKGRRDSTGVKAHALHESNLVWSIEPYAPQELPGASL